MGVVDVVCMDEYSLDAELAGRLDFQYRFTDLKLLFNNFCFTPKNNTNSLNLISLLVRANNKNPSPRIKNSIETSFQNITVMPFFLTEFQHNRNERVLVEDGEIFYEHL